MANLILKSALNMAIFKSCMAIKSDQKIIKIPLEKRFLEGENLETNK